jgi:hypothetical protein
MHTHFLVDPFEINDGSLANLSPQEVFTLGVEWAMFRVRLEDGKPFRELCGASNAQRLQNLAERFGRFSECRRTSIRGLSEVWVGTSISGCEPREQESM